MPNYPKDFINAVAEANDIVEVIGKDYFALTKKGKDYWACCPFHDEKTPSFTVSPKKQFYHCFGCGAHGSAIGFLMQYEGLEFRDAIEDLARAAGLKVPTSGKQQPRPDVGLYDVLQDC